MEWFGQLPQNWEVMPLWTLLSPRINKNTDGQEQNLLSLSYGHIIRKDIETRTGLLPASFNGYNIIEAGDIVLRLTDLQNDMRSLRSGLAKEHGIITSAYLSLKPVKDCQDTRYFHYLLHSFDVIKGFYNMGEGIRQNLNYDELSSLKLPLPPLDEQSRIASYLDSHIAKIDESITRYKALSDKLDEYRKAVITKAVTEGIQGERVMKKSIIPWELEIPDEWREVRTKFVCIHHKDIAGEDSANYERLALTLNGVIKRDKTDTDGLQPKEFNGYQILNQGELVFKLIDLENISTSRVGYSPYTGIVSPAYIILTPKSIYPQFAEFYYLSMWRRAIFNQLGDSGVRSSLSASDLKEIPIPVPSIEEQKEIVSYLDKKCAGINEAKEKIESFVKKLEEYKKSLIYNAVTGKIEC